MEELSLKLYYFVVLASLSFREQRPWVVRKSAKEYFDIRFLRDGSIHVQTWDSLTVEHQAVVDDPLFKPSRKLSYSTAMAFVKTISTRAAAAHLTSSFHTNERDLKVCIRLYVYNRLRNDLRVAFKSGDDVPFRVVGTKCIPCNEPPAEVVLLKAGLDLQYDSGVSTPESDDGFVEVKTKKKNAQQKKALDLAIAIGLQESDVKARFDKYVHDEFMLLITA